MILSFNLLNTMALNYLKSFDYFGYPALMHFGRNPSKKEDGDKKITTIIGALYSIGLRAIYILAIYFYMTKMINATDNQISSVSINASWEALMKA